MRGFVLRQPGRPLEETDLPETPLEAGQIRIRIESCGVCRTDLHLVDGELPDPTLPIVPGHQIVGRIDEVGRGVDGFEIGERIGVPWLGWTDGTCRECRSGRENLCENARFTGYQIDGGYAESTIADSRYCFRLPERYDSIRAAPLLCAGLIGYRSYRMVENARTIGFYGFGSAAHILTQLAAEEGRRIFAFVKPGDVTGAAFAKSLGAVWTGGSDEQPPEKLDAAILFAPVGSLVPTALRAVAKGGVVVCAGIHMSDIPSFPYELLWGERVVRSVANLTREDGLELFRAVEHTPIDVAVTEYPLEQCNAALDDLRAGRIEGSAVLVVG